MIKRTIIFCIAISSILFGFKSSAQESNSNVTITASGRGDSQAQAQQYALRSAIEQAYGAFISSKTEILNDEIVADQMTSVASGNIQSFEILNETELPDHSWASTIKALVSVEKLTSFVQSKGIEVEIKGGLFAANIKQQMLNEQGEVEAIYNMVGVLHEVMQTAFDYEIVTQNPTAIGSDNQNWNIPVEISVKTNDNFNFCGNYFYKTLSSVSLNQEEVMNYMKLGKKVYPILVFTNEKAAFFLRNKKSIEILFYFLNNFEFYTKNFNVSNGLDTINIEVKNKIDDYFPDTRRRIDNLYRFTNHYKCAYAFDIYYKFTDSDLENYKNLLQYSNNSNGDFYSENFYVKFPPKGTTVSEIKFSDQRSLHEIERISSYKIITTGIVSKFKNGGIVIYEKDGHGLVMSIFDIGPFKHDDKPWDKVTEFNISGYNDWRIPTNKETKYILEKITKKGQFMTQPTRRTIAGGWVYDHWAFNPELNSYDKAFINGESRDNWSYLIRPVRNF